LSQDPIKTRLAQLPARDPVAALATVGGDADLAAELFAALLAGLPDEMDHLRGCLAESDWTGLAEYAHQVRGATRYCGVPALDEATETLERVARLQDPELVARAFAGLEAEILRVQQGAD
jgi:HPt (histidine-containing phosphotransfer) domain-containing protein